MRRTRSLLTTLFALLIAALSHADTKLVAGDGRVWILTPTPTNDGVQLFTLDPWAPQLDRVAILNDAPQALAAQGDDYTIAIAGPPPADGDPALFRFRTGGVQPVARGILRYIPMSPLPPLKDYAPGIAITSIAHSETGLAIIVNSEGQPPRLLRLLEGEWRESPLPPQSQEPTLILFEGAIAVATRTANDERTVWALDPDGEWSTAATWVGGPAIGSTAGAPVALRTSEAGLQAIAHQPDGPVEIVDLSVPDPSAQTVLVKGPEDAIAIVQLWNNPEGIPYCRAVLSTGEELFTGPVVAQNPLRSSEALLIVMMIASSSLTIALFILRGGRERAIPLPTGVALGQPGGRMLATLIDAIPAIIAVSAIWQVSPLWWLDPARFLVPAHGVTPIFIAMGIYLVTTLTIELATGASLGKRLVGMRVVSRIGKPATPTQVIARTLAKALCPGLLAFVLFDPFSPHPGSFGTVVVRTAKASPGDPPTNPSSKSDANASDAEDDPDPPRS